MGKSAYARFLKYSSCVLEYVQITTSQLVFLIQLFLVPLTYLIKQENTQMPFSHTTYLPIKRFLLCWLTIGGQCSKKESILEYTKHTIRKNVCSTWSDAKWSEKACVCAFEVRILCRNVSVIYGAGEIVKENEAIMRVRSYSSI